MKIIAFKNGDKIKVIDDIANVISERLTGKGAKDWQTFTDPNNKDFLLIFNLSEVNYISSNDVTI